MERESGLDIIKLSEKDFLRTLENGVRFGRAVLLENIQVGGPSFPCLSELKPLCLREVVVAA
jgi:hypothetical protein